MKTIEWRDESGPHKVRLPDGCNDVELGIPYGEPWEAMVRPIPPERIAQALRDHGIWTMDDLRVKVKQVKAALLNLVGAEQRALLETTKEVQK